MYNIIAVCPEMHAYMKESTLSPLVLHSNCERKVIGNWDVDTVRYFRPVLKVAREKYRGSCSCCVMEGGGRAVAKAITALQFVFQWTRPNPLHILVKSARSKNTDSWLFQLALRLDPITLSCIEDMTIRLHLSITSAVDSNEWYRLLYRQARNPR
jgi:hypothetical protein